MPIVDWDGEDLSLVDSGLLVNPVGLSSSWADAVNDAGFVGGDLVSEGRVPFVLDPLGKPLSLPSLVPKDGDDGAIHHFFQS